MITTDNVTYTVLDGHIHYIKIQNSNRQTVEDIFTLFSTITQSMPTNNVALLLVDTNGVSELPIRYMIQRADQWEKEQTQIMPTRTAVLYNSNNLLRFGVNMLIKKFSKYDTETQIFQSNQYAEAVEWLHSSA